MRLKGNSSTEFRFELIIRLTRAGKTQKAIAELLDCDQSWVSRVLKRYAEQGQAGLKVKIPVQKRPSRLTKEQLEHLSEMLLQGALAHGFGTDNWTRERMAQLVLKHFGISYHPAHMSKVMRKIGFTVQKPKAKSYRKDEQSVLKWREEQLPRLKKSE